LPGRSDQEPSSTLRSCYICGAKLQGRQRAYCSALCRRKARTDRRRRARTARLRLRETLQSEASQASHGTFPTPHGESTSQEQPQPNQTRTTLPPAAQIIDAATYRAEYLTGIQTIDRFYEERGKVPPSWVRSALPTVQDLLDELEREGADLRYVLFVATQYRQGWQESAQERLAQLDAAFRQLRSKFGPRIRQEIRAQWKKRADHGSFIPRELLRLCRSLVIKNPEKRVGQGLRAGSVHVTLALGHIVDHLNERTGKKHHLEAGLIVDAFSNRSDFTGLVDDSGRSRARSRYGEFCQHQALLARVKQTSIAVLRHQETKRFDAWLRS